MVIRRQQATKFIVVCGLMLAATVAGGFIESPVATAASPVLAQGFSEIVKKVNPAVVNIAVTGGGGESRSRARASSSGGRARRRARGERGVSGQHFEERGTEAV